MGWGILVCFWSVSVIIDRCVFLHILEVQLFLYFQREVFIAFGVPSEGGIFTSILNMKKITLLYFEAFSGGLEPQTSGFIRRNRGFSITNLLFHFFLLFI